MNRTEYLLACLAEECAEVAQRATKALRFGMDEVQSGQQLTNAERITAELVDLFTVATMLEGESRTRILPDVEDCYSEEKANRVEATMAYSLSMGTLTDGDDA
jgi:NTP pyrophosphatase (non-canonical NTP hydrolase)